MSAAVVSTSVTGSAAIRIQRRSGSLLDHAPGPRRRTSGRWRRSAGRRSGRRPAPAAPPHRGSASVSCSPALPVDPAELGLVRPPHPAEHVEDRQGHRDHDAGQHAEQRDAEQRGDREPELGPPLLPEPAGAAMSASDRAAAMTIAPRVGCGTYCIREVANTRTKVMTAAPTRPVTCDRDPACSATAVRDPLVLTGKPWKKPAAMFAAPIPIISWSPCTCSPRRAAKAEAVDMVSARATTAMASAPMTSAGMSDHDQRDGERREPLRQHADRVDAVGPPGRGG